MNHGRQKVHKCILVKVLKLFLLYIGRPARLESQIREQMSSPDLHVFTLKFLALKNWFFPGKKYFPKFFWLLFTFILCTFSKKIKLIFCPWKFKKNGAQKLLIIGPDPFISQSSPAQTTDHSPQPRIDFSYYEISGPDIFSLICGKKHDR